MAVPNKRKRDVDCPRITYDTSTMVFDRLFKEESLEEMKDVVRKKLGLSSSNPVRLSPLRDGKPIVLDDDDDFDAFYVSVYSTAVTKIIVYLGDHQPSKVGPDASFTGAPMQLLESSSIHHAADPISEDQSLGSNSKESTNTAKDRVDATKSKKRPRSSSTVEHFSEVLNGTAAPRIDNLKPELKYKSSEDLGNAVTDLTDDHQADIRKGPEEPQPSGVDVSTWPPKEKKKKYRMEVVIVGKKSNAALRAPVLATSNSPVVVQCAKKQDPKPPAATSRLRTSTYPSAIIGKKETIGRSTHFKPTLRKTLTKKSRKNEAEANDKAQARSSATKAAVDAIFGKILSSKGSSSSPSVNATAPSPSIAPVASSSSRQRVTELQQDT